MSELWMDTSKAITITQERAGSLLEQGDHIGAVKNAWIIELWLCFEVEADKIY